MVVLEGQLVLALFWHLHPHSSLADPAALGPVGLQQVFFAVAMKTSLTEVLALPVPALIIQKAVEVEFAGILSQQQVDARHVGRLFAEVMDNYSFFPVKDVDGQVILFSYFGDLLDGRGDVNALEVESILYWVLGGPLGVFGGWKQGRPEGPSEALVILVFHINDRLLVSYSCG